MARPRNRGRAIARERQGFARERQGFVRERGQAVVELALTIPLIVLMLLSIVQVGLVVRDQILVVHAAREGARAGAVSADSEAVQRAAARSSGLIAKRMKVNVSGRGPVGSTLTVTIHYSSPTEVPLVGALLPDVGLRAVASMRVEM